MPETRLPFRCLAIESASSVTSIAACTPQRMAWRELAGLREPSRVVYTHIQALFAELDLEPGALDCIAFGAGPGSFTGVRVAAGVAQALGWALRVPVARVSTLAVLAETALRRSGVRDRPVAPALDARRGQLYAACYVGVPDGGLQTLRADQLLDRAGAGDWPGAARPVGPGWIGIRDDADHGIRPDARDLLAIAYGQHRNGALLPAMEALPYYLRDNIVDPVAASGVE